MNSDHQNNVLAIAKKVITQAPNYNYDFPEEPAYVHVNRKIYIDKIIKYFLDHMTRYVQNPDYLIIIRWFYTQKLLDFTHVDPLIPHNTDDNESLFYELEKIGVPFREIRSLQDYIFENIKRFNKNYFNRYFPITVWLTGDTYTFTRERVKFYLKVETYNKLKRLYLINGVNQEDDKFHERVFALWCRYESLAAPGYQAAIPQAMFDLLANELQVNHELYASPFNCNERNSYTSAYPDIDKFFGSQGNIYGEYPRLFEKGGSFEANPPFLEEHMAALSLIIQNSLESTGTREVPLSFVVIYPAWEDAIGYSLLVKSKYNILVNKVLLFDRFAHYYTQSSQYWNKDGSDRKANSRSAIFILQNDAGRVKYQITEKFLDKLIESFK